MRVASLATHGVLVSSSSSALVISAPEWRPPRTLVYLCPAAPTKTVVGLVDAGTISLSADCVAYGLIDTGRGLETTLGYGNYRCDPAADLRDRA